jgi:phospholipid transport system substrate-binding protein
VNPDKNPKYFVKRMSVILDPVISFEYIAKGVIGDYSRNLSKDNISKFLNSFKLGLVNTYGKGMASFSQLEISVLPPKTILGENRRTTVVQQIKGDNNVN